MTAPPADATGVVPIPGPPAPGPPTGVAEHLAAVLAVAVPLEPLQVALGEAVGCLLAEDMTSAGPLPPVGTALLDGYALRVADVAGASPATPVLLPVVGDVGVGGTTLPLSVQPGCAVRVSAGAPLPPGSEVVVPTTWTDGGLARVAVLQAPAAGGFARTPGEDLGAGALLLAAGTHLGPAQVALLAAAGAARVVVRPRPRVVIVSTARGLVDVGKPAGPGQTIDANSHALAAASGDAGAQPYRVGILPEDPRRLADALEDHLIRADVVLASGGGSGAVPGGGGDVVAEVLTRLGSVRHTRLALQPGGTFAVGTVGPDATPFLGVPGPPLAALVGFELFVRPALRRMLGIEPLHRPRVTAVLTRAVRSPAGVRQYLRCALRSDPAAPGSPPAATPLGRPGMHPLQGLGGAQALVEVLEETTDLPVGGRVEALLLERRHA